MTGNTSEVTTLALLNTNPEDAVLLYISQDRVNTDASAVTVNYSL
jgi:hypothetical protein